MPVVRLEAVSFSYGRGPEVLSEVDLSVDPGEFVGIAGPNGGGKTTLVRLIVGLEQPRRGRVELFGDGPRRRRRPSAVGYLPQRVQLGLDAPTTVEELVAAGRTPLRGVVGPLGGADQAAIGMAIERVGLTDKATASVSALSGGEQQRAFIAKALAGEPELLVLDEPTTGVDAQSQETLAELVDGLRRSLGVTVLYVSHEFGAIESYVERLVLVRGGIVFDGPPAALPGYWHDPSHGHP